MEMITQERIVVTILFITFLVVAYRFLKLLYKKPVMGGSTSCSSGACSTCSFNSEHSCADKSYIRKEQVSVKKLKL
jgi:hypothetical protein